MKVMKKLLIGAVCVLTFAVSAYAANEGEDNDQNDGLDHAIVNMDNNERELESQLRSAIHSWNGETNYENDGILNDTIIPLIRQGADITDEHIRDINFGVFNLAFLSRVVFHNSRYDELPDDVKNRILGKSLLYYVEKRDRGGSENLGLDRNYDIIRCLLKKFHAPTNYLNSEGRTVLEIVENRNNLWENETYDLADDPEFGPEFSSFLAAISPEVAERVKARVKKHDQKVYKLFHNNCCSIM